DCPDITLRSTFIVGYPGETETEFQHLLDWLDEAQLDRVGCFQYENVDGARSNVLKNHVEPDVKQDRWEGWRPTHLVGTKLTGKTLGIIGFGRIGQEVAKRAHHGFGMKILVQNRSSIDPSILSQTNAVQINKIDDLLPDIDFLSLHCPGGEENRDLIGSAELQLMKKEAILINTARGEVVNDPALIYALKNNIINAAGLDVYNEEPNLNKEYLDCPNAILLPHLGSATNETREAMGFRVIKNLNEFFSGKAPEDKVS
ncbi:hypothetical protein N9581_02120, partial [Amylibacter sp.]|nr:hypothetical protein [Amylibacter sp.]